MSTTIAASYGWLRSLLTWIANHVRLFAPDCTTIPVPSTPKIINVAKTAMSRATEPMPNCLVDPVTHSTLWSSRADMISAVLVTVVMATACVAKGSVTALVATAKPDRRSAEQNSNRILGGIAKNV
jgi:hypothetical protein